MYRGPRVVLWLFNLQASSLGEGELQLGKRQTQDTICIFCFDLIGIHAGDIKASLLRNCKLLALQQRVLK